MTDIINQLSNGEPYVVDRKDWSSGPWDNEPDKVEWRAHGLPCIAVRVRTHGAWCGYVAVPPGHPEHGVDHAGGGAFDVHGGTTYSNRCSPDGTVCHTPKPGEPDDVWWIGFDTVHAWDVTPTNHYTLPTIDGCSYKTLEYVRAETEKLAKQLAERSEP